MNTDIRSIVEKHSAIPVARLRVLHSVDDLHLTEMRRGIVFVFAAWSGPAIIGLKRFTNILNSFEIGPLDVVVLDADCLNQSLANQLFGIPSFTAGGAGETLWIRDGHVSSRVLAYAAPESLVEQHTRELLDDRAP